MFARANVRRLTIQILTVLLVAAGLTVVPIPNAPPAYAGTVSTLLTPATVHADGAELEWTRYSLAAGETFASYEVHRSATAGFTPSATTLLATIRDIDVLSWRDGTARPSTAFSYRIVANSLVSNEQRVTLPASGRTVKTLQLDGRVQASYLVHDDSTPPACSDEWNYGGAVQLRIGTSVSGWIHRPVLRFDLRDVPVGSTVVSATLSMFYLATSAPGAAINVHRLQQPWEEGTGTGQCNGSGVSWSETERGVRWKTGGSAFDPTADFQLPAKSRTLPGTDVYTVTNLVQEWVDGTPNHGALLKLASDTPGAVDNWFDYSSNNASTPSARPLLSVEYVDQSTATGPRVVLAAPAQNSVVRGSVTLTAAAGDDRRVDQVEFFVDGGATPVATATGAPWQGSWNSVGAANGTHTITARATDDVGQQKTTAARTVSVDNSAAPSGVTLTTPANGSSVSGTVTVSGNASDDLGVTRVEFLVDDHVVGTDTVAPFSTTWDTLDPLFTAYDGSHQVKVRAYDAAGQSTTSAVASVTTTNTTATKYKASYDLNQLGPSDDPFAIPPMILKNEYVGPIDVYSGGPSLRNLASAPQDGTAEYPEPGTSFTGTRGGTDAPSLVLIPPPEKPKSVSAFQCEVTVTNLSGVAWKGNEMQLWYRWYTLDGTILFEGVGNEYFPQTLQPGQSKRIPITVEPPKMPEGIDLSQVRLRFDIYDYASTSANKWFGGKGNAPSDNPVVVDHSLDGNLGLERYWQYEAEDVGAGMSTLTNVANGNMLLRASPFFAPGRGLATVLDLTYNSLEDHSKSPAGNNFSLSISGLTRFGEPLDIHPNNADTISGKSNKYVVLTDGDGTTHRFNGTTNADGTTTWTEPPGVNLYLRTTTDPNPARRWALTRPDNVTFYFDPDGFPTAVADRNGNTLTFTLQDTPPGEDPGGPKRRITTVTDTGGRTFGVDYFSKAEAKKAHVRGKIQRITDHSGSALDFEYYDDGNLRKLIQRGGTKANGEPLADRAFVFTYTTSNGAGAAITDPALRVDPDEHTPNQSTRIFSVRDPNGKETTYTYYGPGSAQLRWKLQSRTNRVGQTTNFTYNITTRRTTVDAPLSRDTDYLYDTTGKVTSIVNPLEQTIQLQWTTDFKVSRVTEPTGKFISYTYNHNGYLTSVADQLSNRTDLTYLNRQIDSRDALGHWSLLQTRTMPRGTATATVGDFQWRYTYDPAGNVDLITDPANFVTNYDWNLAGSANPGTVSRVTDPNLGVTLIDYDPSGQPSRITDQVNRVTQFGYDIDGQLIWVQDPNHFSDTGSDVRAYRTYFDFDSFHRLGRQSAPKSTQFDRGRIIWSSADFDPNDNVIQQIDPHYGGVLDDGEDGPVRTARYDAMDRIIEQANPDRSIDPLGERTQYSWDAAGRITKQTKPKGVQSGTVDDFTSAYTYDELDRIIRQVDFGTSTAEARYIHMCYDLAGDLRSVTSPRAGLTSLICPGTGPATAAFTKVYDYDAAHRMVKQRDPLGHEMRRGYDPDNNVVLVERDIDTSVTPARVNRTEMFYDPRDLPVRTEELFDSSTGRKLVTLIDFDGNRNRTRLVSPRAFDAAGGTGTYTNYVTGYTYDKADQLIRTDLPFDATETERQYTHRAYDGNGNLTSVSLPVTTIDPAQLGDTARTKMTYFDPRWVRTSDESADPEVSFDYAAQGFQIRRTPDKQGAPGEPDTEREMRWTFYDDGMLRERRDSDGNPSTYTYDVHNLLVSARDASGVHGADDTPVLTEAIYTGFDEVFKVRHKKESASTWTFSRYRYDPNGNVDRRFENGKETGADINTATQTAAPRENQLTYDAADWLATQLDLGTDSACKDDQRIVNTFWGTGWERKRDMFRGDTTCTADPATWKLRQVTTWDHFNNGKLKTLTTTAHKPDGTSEVTEKHDVGYFEGTRYENGHRTTDSFIRKRGDSGTTCAGPTPCLADYDYDARDRLIKHQKRANVIARYTFDQPSQLIGDTTIRAGNITTEDNAGEMITRRYEGNRIKELSTAGATASYVYDNFGNVDCVTLGAGGSSCSGTLVQDYAYDNLNRLVSQKTYGQPGVATDTADYTYDALDRVNQEVENHDGTSRTTDFTYQGVTKLVTEEKQSGGTNPKTKTFSYDAYGHRISMTDKDNATAATETFTYANDVHGSVSQLITEGGTVKASYGYDAYGGEDAALSTGDLDDRSPINPYRFQADRLDSGSATATKPATSVDMGARRYGVDTGRFLQQDMFANALGDLALTLDPLTQNSYSLAGGNPVSFVEIDGHMLMANGGGGGTSDPNPSPGDDGGGLLDKIGDFVRDLGDKVGDIADDLGNIGNTLERVGSALRTGARQLGKTIGKAADSLDDLMDKIKPLAKYADRTEDALRSFGSKARKAAKQAAPWMSKWGGKLSKAGTWGTVIGGGIATIGDILQGKDAKESFVRNGLKAGGSIGGSAALGWAGATIGLACGPAAVVCSPALGIAGGIAGGIIGQAAGDWVGDVIYDGGWEKVKDDFSDLGDAAGDLASDAADTVTFWD